MRKRRSSKMKKEKKEKLLKEIDETLKEVNLKVTAVKSTPKP
jgi:tRNA A37 threonylcarbamoyladenosine modification protein TsaB